MTAIDQQQHGHTCTGQPRVQVATDVWSKQNVQQGS